MTRPNSATVTLPHRFPARPVFAWWNPGNVVQAAGTTVLVVITQEQPITVVFTLAEDSLGQVQTRMRQMHTLPVDAWDRSQTAKIASGKMFSIDNQIDTTTGTVKARALFDNKNGALFPNQFVNTRLLVNTLKGVTLVPLPLFSTMDR